MDNQSICRGSAGIHNTTGALGGFASKWGLGVFHSILGNDLYYEASEHFMRVPERAVVVVVEAAGADLQLSQNKTWRHVTCSTRPQLKLSIWNRYPKPPASNPSPPPPHPEPVSSSLKQEQSAVKGEMGIGQGEGSGEMRLSSEKGNETKSV